MSIFPTIKRILTSNWFLLLVMSGLYLTGLHTPVIAFLQRGILTTGLLQPDTSFSNTDTPAGPTTTTNLDFRMVDPAGQAVDARTLVGKVVFINLWASWCAPCLAEMPNITALWKDYASDERVAFIMLNTEADFNKGLEYVGRRGYGFPVYHLQGGLPKQLRTGTLPSTFVLSPSGEIVVAHSGMAQYDTRAFRALLEELVGRVE